MNAYPAIEELIPHRPPNLLIDAVDQWTPEGVTAHARMQPDAWFAEADGSTPGWIGLEFMAQTVAVFVGLEKHRQHQPPKPGYLLGTSAYRCQLPAFPPDTRLDIHAHLVFREASGLGAFDCRIEINGQAVAEATLKVYEEVTP